MGEGEGGSEGFEGVMVEDIFTDLGIVAAFLRQRLSGRLYFARWHTSNDESHALSVFWFQASE